MTKILRSCVSLSNVSWVISSEMMKIYYMIFDNLIHRSYILLCEILLHSCALYPLILAIFPVFLRNHYIIFFSHCITTLEIIFIYIENNLMLESLVEKDVLWSCS